MSKQTKTNVMRILDRAKISYEALEYPHGNEALEGNEVAALMGQNPSAVFKTLVARGKSGEYYVFDIPVNTSLDLKKAAKTVGEKYIEMLHVKDILSVTGYIRGGCTPIGMKKQFSTVLDESALQFDEIIISGGCLGAQIHLAPGDLVRAADAAVADITE